MLLIAVFNMVGNRLPHGPGEKPQEVGGHDSCQVFYDSMVALADTAVDEDEDYSRLYTLKDVSDTFYHLTYPVLTFHTGDRNWDKMLNKAVSDRIMDDREGWIKEFAPSDDKEYRELWERTDHNIIMTPVYISEKWASFRYGYNGYYGGAHTIWEYYYIHFYREKGHLKQVNQRDFFIYDRDSSVRERFYHRILKGMDTKIKWDTVYYENKCNYHAYNSFQDYTIGFRHFTETGFYDSGIYRFNLIPAKTGLKTKLYESNIANYEEFDFAENIIIPYKHFKGIIKEEYLKAWSKN